MKTLKTVFASLAITVISTASFAGEMTWTGSAEVTYNINSSDGTNGANDAGKALGVSNDLSWAASGELDNGMSWKVSGDLDSGTVDDTYMTLTTDYGTFGFYNDDGGTNYKHTADQAAYGTSSDKGTSGSMVDAYDVGGYSNIRYTLPADIIPFLSHAEYSVYVGGTSATVDAAAAGSEVNVDVKSIEQGAVKVAPIDGLEIGAQYYNEEAEAAATDGGQEKESGTVYLTYAVGPATIGLGQSLVAPAIASTTSTFDYYENNLFSVGFAVNEALSVSLSREESAKQDSADSGSNTFYDLEIDSIQAAYTAGGMTLAITHESMTNSGYADGADVNETMVSMKMDF